MCKENRKYKRIDFKYLPDWLKEIAFILKKSGKFKANPIEVSRSGMSFFSTGLFEKELYKGAKVTIVILSKKLKLKSIVAHTEFKYVKEIEQNLLRFGIKFLNNNSLKLYHKLLDEYDKTN